MVVVADAQTPSDRSWPCVAVPVFRLFVTEEPAGHVIDVLRSYLTQHFAERLTRHGVFMDILGWGSC